MNRRDPKYIGTKDRLCVVEIGVDGGEPRRVEGAGIHDWIKALGYSDFTGHRITYFKMLRNHDGWLQERKHEEPKPKKRASEKRLNKELQKLEKYLQQ